MWNKPTKLFLLLVLFSLIYSGSGQEKVAKQHPELPNLARSWAQKLGGELWHFGELVTRRTRVNESFKRHSVIKEESGETILKAIHEKIYNMTKEKVEAVKRIMDIAEEAAKAQREEEIDVNYQFVNAKNLTNSAPNYTLNDQEPQEVRQDFHYDDSFITSDRRFEERYQAMVQQDELDGYQQDQDQQDEEEEETDSDIEVTDGSEKDPQASQVPQTDRSKLPLYRNRNFYNIPVNTNFSAVHVPSNVYERSKEVISGIIWSELLDKTFKNNYKQDPTLSWQYFGSSTGFMRQFPAMIWSQEPIDLFDCRTRSWYIEAASSPKDVVILVDRSGSMTGMRREIARHVVHNILDTLGNNDYVNIFTFSNTTDPLIECFDNILVQANLANVRVLKEAMADFKTEQIANLSLALVTAFQLLENYRNESKGANCNQAIMLVTDGVQDNYMEIFRDYNWDNLPFINVRVFTYLIGREVSDVRDVKWMACANRGYYVHLSTYAEVREEVLQYIPVMARPMVLNANQKPNPTWSPVYADVTDPKLTNWLWVNRERNKQRERLLAYFGRKKTLLPSDEQDKKFVHQQKHKQDNFGELQTYRLMTSVSLPVYDRKPRANITEKIQINEAIWISITREERVANLLGVAGTDIPIEYIESLMLPYRLGVNGYAFIVTNNGYILTHPDLRPVYQGILKPAYNRVDMTEVEVMNDDSDPRSFSDQILEFRRRVVMQEKGDITLQVKSHIDEMRRLVTTTRHYFYMGVNNTPFSLVIALPAKYGFNKVEHPVENDIHRMRSNDKIDKSEGWLTQFFTGNWTLHPDWHYCRYLDNRYEFETPEEEFLHFLRKIEGTKWKWVECDRGLIVKVVADAKITSWFSENITNSNSSKEENGPIAMLMALIPRDKFIRRFGITVAFLATHSGLTRWQDFPQNVDAIAREEPSFRHFHMLHNKAIDEIWYRRAVEYHYVDPTAYIYSVPFDIGAENNTLLTVSHAIFREDGGKKAPAAVIGYQSYHSALYALFRNITTSCGDIPCKRTCDSDELDCFLLDDNGYIIVSDDLTHTGFFFGKVRPDIMSFLVDEGIYKVTRMYDYQGLCPEEHESNNPASTFSTPLDQISRLIHWATATFFYLLHTISAELETISYPEEDHEMHSYDSEHDFESETTEQPSRLTEKEFDQRVLLKKTKPEPCDYEMWFYTLVHYPEKSIPSSGYNKAMTDDCTRPFIVQRVFNSNMILLVVNSVCWEKENTMAKMPDPVLVDYNMSLACYRALFNNFTRRHYMSCINRNVNESEIKLCGDASVASFSLLPLILLTIVHLII
ncbi:voltage-dependent calcium channel subunit alpha-2/delta-3 isoform X3 [Tribolium castaneum]|uniref:voltage-dependent calcium channel subunit alpha-2/delta-3 isoform X3 n=1 Tax=Tribolium castaneum TaxID=7070 RepID=UPI0030FE9B2A